MLVSGFSLPCIDPQMSPKNLFLDNADSVLQVNIKIKSKNILQSLLSSPAKASLYLVGNPQHLKKSIFHLKHHNSIAITMSQ